MCCDLLEFWVLFTNLSANSAYALCAPFLPLEFDKKGIEGAYVGMVFALYSVAVIFVSPLVGKVVDSWGHKNLLSIGIGFMGIAFIFFGFIEVMESKPAILILGCVLRFLQGMASAFVQTTCYTIATNDFPEKQERLIGLLEAMAGFGLIAGPIIGSALYSFLGFEKTFFVYGGFEVLLAIVIRLNVPDRRINLDKPQDAATERLADLKQSKESINDEGEEQKFEFDIDEDEEEKIQKQNYRIEAPVSYCGLFAKARFTFAALSSSLAYFNYCHMEPILAPRLADKGLNTMQIGLFFAIFPIAYIPCSMLQQYVPNKIEKRVRMISASVISAVAFMCVGPSQLLKFGDSLVVMGIGQFVVGLMLAMQLIPGLPEMVEGALQHYPTQERDVKNMSSAIFNSFLGVGQVIAPLYGSTLNQFIGFKHTTTLSGALDFVFAVLFFIFAGGATAFSLTYKNYTSSDIPPLKRQTSITEKEMRLLSPLAQSPIVHKRK